MWDLILEKMPTKLGLLCTFLTFIIPYATYHLNQKLHQKLDPPWKKEESPSSAE